MGGGKGERELSQAISVAFVRDFEFALRKRASPRPNLVQFQRNRFLKSTNGEPLIGGSNQPARCPLCLRNRFVESTARGYCDVWINFYFPTLKCA